MAERARAAIEQLPIRMRLAITLRVVEDLPYDATDPKDGLGHVRQNGFLALLADGSVRFVSRAELGIPDGEPIVVGPGSTHAELKKMIFASGE